MIGLLVLLLVTSFGCLTNSYKGRVIKKSKVNGNIMNSLQIKSNSYKAQCEQDKNLLKSATTSGVGVFTGCTYSIGLLYDSVGNGWEESTVVTVSVNNVPVLNQITLSNSKEPVWFDFTVQPDDPILVTHNHFRNSSASDSTPSGNNYQVQVYSESQGRGNLLYNYNGAGAVNPASIPNHCTLPKQIQFVNLPTTIYVGQIFTVEIITSVPVTQTNSLPTTDLNLFCAGVLYETWSNLPINQLSTLTLTADVTQQSDCYLKTPPNSPEYAQAISPVNVQNLVSPFGTPLKYISPAQLSKFLKNFGGSAPI